MVGEVHTTITMNSNVTLPLNALVVTKLEASLIVGMAFMKEHNVVIDIPNNALLVRGNTVPFNNQPGDSKVSLFRAEVNYVVIPDDNLILPVPPNYLEDRHVAVGPREPDFSWLESTVIKNENGFLEIPILSSNGFNKNQVPWTKRCVYKM